MLQAEMHPLPAPLAYEKDTPIPESHPDRQDPASPADDRQRPDPENHLVVSPYTSLPHLLDLRPLKEPQRLLAKALTILQSTRPDYALAPYYQSFNWDAVTHRLKSLLELSTHQWQRQHFYIVVFRSQVPPTTDRTHLGLLDQRSHAEATKSGGLLKYWFGLPDENGRNLATCTSPIPLNLLFPPKKRQAKSPQSNTPPPRIWRDFADARPASLGPGHKEATRATIDMYTEWKLERLRFEIGDGASSWSITSWEG